PIALNGTDLIGQARTGMGKTYGFGVPLLDRVFDAADVPELDGSPRALVVVPTRELSVQVANDLSIAAAQIPVRIATILGGRAFEAQQDALRAGVDVVVGTPARILDLYQRKTRRRDKVSRLVSDEADEMLDIGFLPDVEKMLAALKDFPHQ